jgi:GT2 family glycosyltransferase
MSADVTVSISTRDRYFTTLPGCIVSVALQTVKPKHIIIWDDGEHRDLREDPLYKNIFSLISSKGISWEVAFGDGTGQVKNHQRSIAQAKTEWIWRIDDDNIIEHDVLEKLLKTADENDGKIKCVGAVAGLVLDPKHPVSSNALASNKIEDIYLGLNEQWFTFTGVKTVDHLYSTFIYRKDAAKHGYCWELSKIGHREETIFTYEMKRAGWTVLIDPSAITWHLRFESGGIRSEKDHNLWSSDDAIFARKMVEWGVTVRDTKLIVLDAGLGDHLVFKSVLPKIKAKHKNIVMAVCYPEIFKDHPDIKLISIADAKLMGDMDKYQIYKYLWDRTEKHLSLEEAYEGMYL